MRILAQRDQYTWREAMPQYHHVTDQREFYLNPDHEAEIAWGDPEHYGPGIHLTTNPEKYRGHGGDEINRPYTVTYDSKYPLEHEPGVKTPGWDSTRPGAPEDFFVPPHQMDQLKRQFHDMAPDSRPTHEVDDLEWGTSSELSDMMRNREPV